MSNTNPLIRSHQFNYSPFTEISIIGDIIGDNRSFIGDTIGDIGVTFYDISILNDNLEWSVSTEKELCRGVSVIFMASSQKNCY